MSKSKGQIMNETIEIMELGKQIRSARFKWADAHRDELLKRWSKQEGKKCLDSNPAKTKRALEDESFTINP